MQNDISQRKSKNFYRKKLTGTGVIKKTVVLIKKANFLFIIYHLAAHLRHHHHISLREQLQVAGASNNPMMQTGVAQQTVTTPGTQKSLFGRLGIRKPSILSLSSPQPQASTARTFSLDDLLMPLPRRKLDTTEYLLSECFIHFPTSSALFPPFSLSLSKILSVHKKSFNIHDVY